MEFRSVKISLMIALVGGGLMPTVGTSVAAPAIEADTVRAAFAGRNVVH